MEKQSSHTHVYCKLCSIYPIVFLITSWICLKETILSTVSELIPRDSGLCFIKPKQIAETTGTNSFGKRATQIGSNDSPKRSGSKRTISSSTHQPN